MRVSSIFSTKILSLYLHMYSKTSRMVFTLARSAYRCGNWVFMRAILLINSQVFNDFLFFPVLKSPGSAGSSQGLWKP